MDHSKSLMTLLLIHVLIQFCTATIDTITSTQPILDHQTIVSSGATFKLGFFSPVNSTNRYVGIWYNDITPKTVVWVANRDKPLNDSSGTLAISNDGNLVVLDGQKQIVWSSEVPPNSLMNSSAQLSDSGNLILRDDSNRNTIWESFEHPTDSFMQKMKLGANKLTGKKIQLTSWKSPSDPSTGSFTCSINPQNIPEFYVWNGSHPYWRTGPWTGQIYLGIPDMLSVYYFKVEIVGKEGIVNASYTYKNESAKIYVALSSDGTLAMKQYQKGKETWDGVSGQHTGCDVYGKCGPFGSCNGKRSPICGCLQGFHPHNMEEWSRGNWSSGCARRRQLQCERNNSDGGEKGKEDGFVKLKTAKVPAFAESSIVSEDECKSQCLNNCSCMAYATYIGIGCMQWSGDLIDIQQFSYGGTDLYIRVAYSELDPIKQKLLDWRKRANIIEGIGRGLLYLHRDSRLKIIHRDLKTSNVLLDENLNSKISDFGMAKIFGGNQDQANTRRVVGTYGYMAPEYAMEGRFSEKSDVFSFGVSLLEIASGRKNTSFYHDEESSSLLKYAWKLWKEDMIVRLIDPTISDPCFQVEILRYIHVGLLCVQEFANNRPTISTVLSMLSREIADLPTPKQPAFTEIEGVSNIQSSQQNQRSFSVNNVTVTTISGR